MSKINFKKLAILLLSLVALTIMFLGIYVYSEFYLISWDENFVAKTPHDDVIHVTNYYQINPNTILSDLENGRIDVFIDSAKFPDISELPSNSFLWKGGDYLAVAEAVHEQEWRVSLAEWHLYSLEFSILRCQQIEEGIDRAEVIYYQQQGDYYVTHGIRITPLFKTITVGENYYPYSGTWTPIELDKLEVKTPSDVLELAETNGGRDAREKQGKDGCYISLYLNPDSLFPSFTTNPFELFGLSWEIEYRSDRRNIYTDSIDPYTGK